MPAISQHMQGGNGRIQERACHMPITGSEGNGWIIHSSDCHIPTIGKRRWIDTEGLAILDNRQEGKG